VLGVGNVVEPDDRNIATDRNSAQASARVSAHGDDVVVTGERGWGLHAVSARSIATRPPSRVGGTSKIKDSVGGESPAIERIAPTGDAFALRHHGCGAPDKSDTTMAKLQQVLYSGTFALLIVGTDVGE